MTVRAGMTNLIQRLREDASAATGEFVLAGGTYWSDDHLQRELDRHRREIYQEAMSPVVTYDNDGNPQYFDYYWRRGNVEEATSGSAAWELENVNGSAIGTADYNIDYNTQHIQFLTSTDASLLYLTYRSYDMNRAAADVWEKKAANVANRFDVKTDNHDLTRSQLFKQYMQMAAKFRRRAGSGFKQQLRGDLTSG